MWEKKTLHVSQQLSMYNVLGKSGIEKNSVKIEEGRKEEKVTDSTYGAKVSEILQTDGRRDIPILFLRC